MLIPIIKIGDLLFLITPSASPACALAVFGCSPHDRNLLGDPARAGRIHGAAFAPNLCRNTPPAEAFGRRGQRAKCCRIFVAVSFAPQCQPHSMRGPGGRPPRLGFAGSVSFSRPWAAARANRAIRAAEGDGVGRRARRRALRCARMRLNIVLNTATRSGTCATNRVSCTRSCCQSSENVVF
jgi:hypothetical protein